MMRIITTLPRHVLISLGVMAGALVLFGILLPLLGGARDNSFADNRRIQGEITRANQSKNQTQADREFLIANQEKYEALMKSDRLVPHSPRAAGTALEEAARVQGPGFNFTYTIGAVEANSATAAQSQPVSGAYQVSIETITLKITAPLDGPVYRFIADITNAFPGSIVVQYVKLARTIGTPSAPSAVQGDVTVSWRTAQATEKKE